MNFTVFLILLVILGSFIAFSEMLLLKKRKEKGKIYYKWVFPLVFMVYIFMTLSTFWEYFTVKREINFIIVGLGLSFIIVRFLLKYWAIESLSKYWSVQVEIRENHKLIKSGPYKYIRHPGYLSTIFDMIVIPIIANAFYTLIWVLIVYFILLYIRIHTEERALAKKFGKEYIKYKKETGALLPLPKFLLKHKEKESLVL